MTLAEQLRDACDKVRLKSYPLSDLIPLMQQAADALDKQPTDEQILEVVYDRSLPNDEQDCLHLVRDCLRL